MSRSLEFHQNFCLLLKSSSNSETFIIYFDTKTKSASRGDAVSKAGIS